VSRGDQGVLRKWLVLALTVFAVTVTASGCVRHRDFDDDPVKWTFLGGEGTWDGNSRRWSVDLSRGQTKSATMRLDNTSSEDAMVLVQLAGPPDYVSMHLGSSSIALGDNGVGVRAGKSAEISVSATADTVYASASPRRYVVDLSWSTNGPWHRVTNAPPDPALDVVVERGSGTAWDAGIRIDGPVQASAGKLETSLFRIGPDGGTRYAAGDPAVFLEGWLANNSDQEWQVDYWPEAFDARGNQVAWGLDQGGAPFPGHLQMNIAAHSSKSFTLHLTWAESISRITINANKYDPWPPLP
jgi:hypothetical protein